MNILVLYNKQRFEKFQLLKVDDKRVFLQYVFRKWKNYEKQSASCTAAEAKINLKNLREEVYHALKTEVAKIEAFKTLFK